MKSRFATLLAASAFATTAALAEQRRSDCTAHNRPASCFTMHGGSTGAGQRDLHEGRPGWTHSRGDPRWHHRRDRPRGVYRVERGHGLTYAQLRRLPRAPYGTHYRVIDGYLVHVDDRTLRIVATLGRLDSIFR